ncbi:MAG: RNA polymerase sigma-54 factor [Spirochaetes bacterium]|nr:MAG: RNA polymerase sigma-54 factor [Spirochaetota bacterium]
MQSQRPVLRQEQKLRMTPQLYQAIRMMAMPVQDLRQTIREELEKNPALEILEDKTTVSLDDIRNENREDPVDYFDDSSDRGYISRRSSSGEDTKRKFMEGALSKPESLHEHLVWQLRLQPLTEKEFGIGLLVIRNLDDNGFHIEPPETLVPKKDYKTLNKLIKIIQTFDPIGICTKDYQEAILVQIKNHPNPYPGSYEVVEKYLDLLEKGKYKEIAKKIHRTEKDVEAIRRFIRTLEPMPGRKFSDEPPRYVIPDVLVKYKDGDFVIVINDEEIPVLGVNPFFSDLERKKREKKEGKKVNEFVKTNIQNARWFIKSIRQRNETLLKTCKAIVEFQREFFLKGPKYLAPLTLKDIAREIDVHEATVSRITSGKYMQTEWGIYELKYFFSNSITGPGSTGSRYSKEGVKEIIKEIIEGYEGQKRLSDKKIAEILSNRGINIARRTAAKYRKELNIESSYRR